MFKTEEELVKIIKDLINDDIFSPNFGKNTTKKILSELNLGHGIADLVVAHYQKSELKRSRLLNYFDISIFKIIEKNEKTTLEEICKFTRCPKNKIKKALENLIEEDLINLKNDYYFHYNYTNLLTNSIAIEAKLKSWKRALNQAYRYKWFANKSYVFLPEKTSKSAYSNIHLFKRLNVGLASVSNDKQLRILLEPKAETPFCDRMFRMLNEHVIFDD